jgi:hypothetical protein
MDYLPSVIRHLIPRQTSWSRRVIEPGPSELKYAVLHLHAAAEVLLKARLIKEHWSLVFMTLESASNENYRTGDIKSCGTMEAVRRLRKIAGVDIGNDAEQALTRLEKSRNRLQHYGLTESAAAIEARTAEVLDFLLHFVEEQLLPTLGSDEQAEVNASIVTAYENMSEIRGLVEARMNRLQPELEPLKDRTVQCPFCKQWALVVDGDGVRRLRCRCCMGEPLQSDLFGPFTWSPGQQDDDLADDCPQCGAHTLLSRTHLADAKDTPRPFCFECATRFDDLARCTQCQRLLPPSTAEGDAPAGDEDRLCDDCIHREIARLAP